MKGALVKIDTLTERTEYCRNVPGFINIYSHWSEATGGPSIHRWPPQKSVAPSNIGAQLR